MSHSELTPKKQDTKSQQSTSSTQADQKFGPICALNKRDIACILLRYNELVDLYRNKFDEIDAALDENTTDQEKITILDNLLNWSKTTAKLDPYIGNYETIKAKDRIYSIIKRKVQFNCVSPSTPSPLTDSEKTMISVKTRLPMTSSQAKSGPSDPEDETEGIEHGRPNHYKLGGNTPTFGSSESDDIHDWIFTVEEGFLSCGIPEDMQLHVVAPFLRGGALKSLKRFITREEDGASWNDFRDQLIKEYEPHDIQSRLKLQFMRLKQSDSFEKYV